LRSCLEVMSTEVNGGREALLRYTPVKKKKKTKKEKNTNREKKIKWHKNPGRSCQTQEHFFLSQKYIIYK